MKDCVTNRSKVSGMNRLNQLFFVFLLFYIGINPMQAIEKDSILIDAQIDTVYTPTDSKKKSVINATYSGFIIPVVFISYGVLTHYQDCLQQFDHKTSQSAAKHFSDKMCADDYTQYIPAVAVFGLDIMGIKAKHNFRDRTFLMASSYLLSTLSVQTMKRTTNIMRPDESDFLSFPSGHTATSFVGAHLLFKEYNTWIGIAGYAVASGTGVMRIFNQKHWVSDVITGAGIGILSVEISCLLLPVFHKLTGINNSKKSLVIAPAIGKNNYGASLAFTF